MYVFMFSASKHATTYFWLTLHLLLELFDDRIRHHHCRNPHLDFDLLLVTFTDDEKKELEQEQADDQDESAEQEEEKDVVKTNFGADEKENFEDLEAPLEQHWLKVIINQSHGEPTLTTILTDGEELLIGSSPAQQPPSARSQQVVVAATTAPHHCKLSLRVKKNMLLGVNVKSYENVETAIETIIDSPTELVGRHYLRDSGNALRQMIDVEILDASYDAGNATANYPADIMCTASVENEEEQERLSYLDLLSYTEQEPEQQEDDTPFFAVEKILRHYQAPGQSESEWSLDVLWKNGQVTVEPLADFGEDDAVMCAKYADKKSLFALPGWEDFEEDLPSLEKSCLLTEMFIMKNNGRLAIVTFEN
jgi:hypothetical protein